MVRRRLPLGETIRHPFRSDRAHHGARGAEYHSAASEQVAVATGDQHANRVVARALRKMNRCAGNVDTACIVAESYGEEAKDARIRAYTVGRRYSARGRRSLRHDHTARGDRLDPARAASEQARLCAQVEREQAGGSTHHGGQIGVLATVSILALLGIDASALYTVIVFFLNPAPGDTATYAIAVAFALFSAGIQAKLAWSVGDRWWAWRNANYRLSDSDSPPPMGALVGLGACLAAVSVLAAASIIGRFLADAFQADAALPIALPIACMLGVCALVAPWIIAGQVAHNGSFESRRIRQLGNLLADSARIVKRALRDGTRCVARARRSRSKAQRCYKKALHQIVRCYGEPRQLILWIRALRGDTRPAGSELATAAPHIAPLVAVLASIDAAIAQAEAVLKVQPSGQLSRDLVA